MLKVLHTSDWHLGRSLYTQKRYDEFELFLNWLLETIEKEKVDLLIVAGDIFDTTTPTNRAQQLYYQFLSKAALSCCKHILIVAGNHDSPSFLNAPADLLKAFNIYVVASTSENPEDNVIVLYNPDSEPSAILCAVPFLRDKDVRTVKNDESSEDKTTNQIEAIIAHYNHICELAHQKRLKLLQEHKLKYLPIIATGHLFTAGGKTVEDDGVREIYVGTLAHINKNMFPDVIDYLALGHLHIAQKAGDSEHIQYSGSPIPMGFAETSQSKYVISIDFKDENPVIKHIQIPQFQRLQSIVGSSQQILEKIQELKNLDVSIWLEIEYTDEYLPPETKDSLIELAEGSKLHILRIKSKTAMKNILQSIKENENLKELNEEDVFVYCMDANNVPDNTREELMNSYKEILAMIDYRDINME